MTRLAVVWTVPEPLAGRIQRVRLDCAEPNALTIVPHVTVIPPTTVDEEEDAAVQQVCDAAGRAVSPFELHLRGTGSFRPTSPVVFVEVVGGARELTVLNGLLAEGPFAGPPRWPFRPHLTLAMRTEAQTLDRAAAALADLDETVPVTALHLVQRGPDRVWRAARTIALTGPG